MGGMERKEPLGFKTPSMQMQEEYKELLEQIMVKKVDWEKLLRTACKLYEHAYEGVGDVIKITKSEEHTHERLMEIEHRVLLSTIAMAQLMVARIDKELAECDIRITEMEKEFKVLRKAYE